MSGGSIALAPSPAPTGPHKLTPLERLEALCDPGTLRLVRTRVHSRRMGERVSAGDGILVGSGEVAGSPVACWAEDGRFLGGSLGEEHARGIVGALELAERARIPVVGFYESAGARLQEGLAALAGYGEIFARIVALSGVVPQISVICGTCAGGGAYAPALTDFVVMVKDAAMFLTGPGVVREVTGEDISPQELGGPRVHGNNGVCQLVAEDEPHAAVLARELLSLLSSPAGTSGSRPSRPRLVEAGGEDRRADLDPGRHVPSIQRKVYDIRGVISDLLDGGELLEISPRWARNVVCALGRLDGRPVGVVANQPRYLGGVLNAEASQKAARFVRTCHLFGVPLLVLVDTPGFMPGTHQEQAGVIRHGAKLVHAFAEARVPKISVILRKSFGGAHIAMNSKALGADLVLAWPGAQIGIMGAPQAVGIVHRRELAEEPDRRGALADAYAERFLAAHIGVHEGFIDELVEPAETRDRLAHALRMMAGASGSLRPARGGNIPL